MPFRVWIVRWLRVLFSLSNLTVNIFVATFLYSIRQIGRGVSQNIQEQRAWKSSGPAYLYPTKLSNLEAALQKRPFRPSRFTRFKVQWMEMIFPDESIATSLTTAGNRVVVVLPPGQRILHLFVLRTRLGSHELSRSLLPDSRGHLVEEIWNRHVQRVCHVN